MATSQQPGAAATAAEMTAQARLLRAQQWVRDRWFYAALAALVFGGVVYALVQASATTYIPIAKDMLAEDQQAAVTALDEASISYKLTAGGISVPEDKIHEARMQLAANPLPSGRTPGFELFDNNTMGRSTFSQKVNFRRALEGELARTVKTLSPVDRARVHLVMPERRLFQTDQATASASVILTLKRGQLLSKRQVVSIQQLVSAAVERLQPSQVAVVDQFGQVLARSEGGMDNADQVIERTTGFERTLEQRVIDLLEPTIGRGRVRVKVAAQLDFSSLQEHQEKFDPESQTVRSEREKLEKTEGSAKPAQGAPGTATNLPTRRAGRAAVPPFTKPAKADRSDSTKNYVVDRSVTKRRTEQPRVQRLSVAVVIDSVRNKDGEIERDHSALELAAYTKLLTTAVGLDPQRGDTIQVASMAFTADAALMQQDPVDPTADKTPTLMDYVMYGIAGFGLLLLLIILVLVLRSRKTQTAAETQAVIDDMTESELEALDSEALATDDAEKVDLAELGLQAEIAALRERAVAQSERDVLVTASVIRRWLHEDEGK